MTAHLLHGIHHITAMASDAQTNLEFYSGILGLRLVKKTVNFDAPEIYHLYYGDETGNPGTILTFFPYPGIPKGRKGKGQLTVTSFSIAKQAIDYWLKRLAKFHIVHEQPQQRFDHETVIYFEDPDGLGLELVANTYDERPGFTYGNIPVDYAIKGFYGVTLSEESVAQTAQLLTEQMGYQLVREIDNRFRFAPFETPLNFVDILCCPDALPGLMGAGTIHHIAFATPSETTQLEARSNLLKQGFNLTPVLDRQYFQSIYFKEPGGVLFEIATIPPGFAIDEPVDNLGNSLKLPIWAEHSRPAIEKELPPLHLYLNQFKD